MRYENKISTSVPSINDVWVNYGSGSSSEIEFPFCDTEMTDGQLLFSGSQSMDNVSCESHVYNAGNYYNYFAASAGSPEPATMSICPRGWMLPEYSRETSYSNFLISYGIIYDASARINQDSAFINLPISLLRSGFYDSILYANGSEGHYRMTSQKMRFHSDGLYLSFSVAASEGASVRCVSR